MDKGSKRQIARVSNLQTNEEGRLKHRIDQLRAKIGSVVAELEQLRTALAQFETRYDSTIGVLIVELDQLELSIAEYERRIELSVSIDWQSVEEQVEVEFAVDRDRIRTQFHETADARARILILPRISDPDQAREIRRLYRQLARRFHPDLATTVEEREHFEQAMRQVNEAMEAADLDTLIRLELELPLPYNRIPGQTEGARIAWMATQVGQLETVLHRLKSELAELKSSSLYALWRRCVVDSNALDALGKELSTDIQKRREVLDKLIEQYRQHHFDRLTVRRTQGA